jgi:NADPH-dependent curcumin reductase CurA
MVVAIAVVGHFWQGEVWGMSGAAGIVGATLFLFVARARPSRLRK